MHAEFELRLPLTVSGSVLAERAGHRPPAGTIRWQVCDDAVCDIPVSESFELEVPLTRSPPVALRGEGADNAVAHFQRMTERRKPKAVASRAQPARRESGARAPARAALLRPVPGLGHQVLATEVRADPLCHGGERAGVW